MTATRDSAMKTRTIGNREVSAIGLGTMPMSIEGRPDEKQSIETIHAALDAGITFIDTADAYHINASDPGHGETLVAKALASYAGDSSDVLVATKGGHVRPGDGSWLVDGSPEHLRTAAKASAQRLGVEAIGLYQFHRPDPKVPFEESVGTLRELYDEGVIRMAGVSNVNPAQIRQARQILGSRLVSVQNQFSPRFRSSLPELELCSQLGLAFLPWSPLGGIRVARGGATDDAYARFRTIAAAHQVSIYRVVLAWELSLAPVVIPIPGASRPESTTDDAQASDLELSREELASLSAS